MTGFQVQQGRSEGVSKYPARARRDGWVVGFTLTLGKPSKSQIAFFRKLYGRSAQARLTILKPDPQQRNMNHRSVAQSETFTLDDYFGSRPTFALRRPLPVKKGEVIALTVPTWAPALATEQSKKEAWRGSRSPKDCENASQVGAHQKVGAVKSYKCLYTTARMLYTALVVHENRKTS